MKLSDVVGGSGLSSYAEIALLIFLGVFLAVVLRALFASRAAMERAARMPLDDDQTPSPSDRGGAE